MDEEHAAGFDGELATSDLGDERLTKLLRKLLGQIVGLNRSGFAGGCLCQITRRSSRCWGVGKTFLQPRLAVCCRSAPAGGGG